jgi:hypothetical protein
MSGLRELLQKRLTDNDKSCMLHAYTHATCNNNVNEKSCVLQAYRNATCNNNVNRATTDATAAQPNALNPHVAVLSPATSDATSEAAAFWQGLSARIDEIDALINRLCDLRHDTDEHRADLLAVRKRMAPNNIDTDIQYLREQIAKGIK